MSVEFVLWVPVLTYLCTGMFVLNIYLAISSEVQQVANELVRSTISQLGTPKTDAQLCAELQSFTLPRVVQSMSLVQASRFQPFGATSCQRDGENFLTVTVTYDLTDSAISRLARMIGFTVTSLERRSVVQL